MLSPGSCKFCNSHLSLHTIPSKFQWFHVIDGVFCYGMFRSLEDWLPGLLYRKKKVFLTFYWKKGKSRNFIKTTDFKFTTISVILVELSHVAFEKRLFGNTPGKLNLSKEYVISFIPINLSYHLSLWTIPHTLAWFLLDSKDFLMLFLRLVGGI